MKRIRRRADDFVDELVDRLKRTLGLQPFAALHEGR